MSNTADPASNAQAPAGLAPVMPDSRPSMSRGLTFLLAITVAVAVGNLYYLHPLMGTIARSFQVPESTLGIAASLAQIGQTLGMLFLLPLGDIHDRRRLILLALLCSAGALLAVTFAPTILFLQFAILLVGTATFSTHLTVSYAASLAAPHERGKVVGTVMSGLLIGILATRVFSGYVGALLGWRVVFAIGAGLLVLLAAVLYRLLPHDAPRAGIRYPALLRSMWTLWKELPDLREASLFGSLTFACFGTFWVTLTFHLEGAPFHYGSGTIGLFGLIGIVGALGASAAGRLADRTNPRFTSGMGIVVLLLAFLVMLAGPTSVALLISGIVILDLGIQATHISNQSRIYALDEAARSRINAVYVVTYFAGGAVGSALGTWVYGWAGWVGICTLGAIFAGTGIAAFALKSRRRSNIAPADSLVLAE
ncbi:MAG: MFS transporter [Chthoniobacteraceae bacterium]